MSLGRMAVAAAVAGGVMIGQSIPAQAVETQWVHPIGWYGETYQIPGPPPGPDLGLCEVNTVLMKDPPGDWADIAINPHYSTQDTCLMGTARIVVWSETERRLADGPLDKSVSEGGKNIALSRGPKGWAVFGANYSALNAWGYGHRWAVTVF